MPRVCCLVPDGPEADSLRQELRLRDAAHAEQLEMVIMPPEEVPGGFLFYACASDTLETMIERHGLSPSQLIAYGPAEALPGAFMLGVRDFLRTPWRLEELSARLQRCGLTQSYELSWGLVECDGFQTRINGCSMDFPAALHAMFAFMVANRGFTIPRAVLQSFLPNRNAHSRVLDNHMCMLRQGIQGTGALGRNILSSCYGKGYRILP